LLHKVTLKIGFWGNKEVEGFGVLNVKKSELKGGNVQTIKKTCSKNGLISHKNQLQNPYQKIKKAYINEIYRLHYYLCGLIL
jgi:hypothetical protein